MFDAFSEGRTHNLPTLGVDWKKIYSYNPPGFVMQRKVYFQMRYIPPSYSTFLQKNNFNFHLLNPTTFAGQQKN